MIEIEPPEFRFCPKCGHPLSLKNLEGEERKFCLSCEWIYYPHAAGAAGAVILQEGKVLLLKRTITPHRGKWDLPAGYIQFGEHPEEAMIRETQEEAGLQVKAKELIGIYQAVEDPRQPGHFFFAYLAESEKGPVTPGNEASEAGWFDLDQLPPLAWEVHAKALAKIREMIADGED